VSFHGVDVIRDIIGVDIKRAMSLYNTYVKAIIKALQVKFNP
jgi:hypothetical protein